MFKLIVTAILFSFSQQLTAGSYTPISHSDFHQKVNLDEAEPWKAPDYSGQEKTLGYGMGGLGVPAGMEERVSFWLDIYTKYTTDQGLLHDSRYVHIVYEPVDFTDIMAQEGLDKRAKRKNAY